MNETPVLLSGSGVPFPPTPPRPSPLPHLEEVFGLAFDRYLARFDALSSVIMVPALFFLIGELFFISSSPLTTIVGFCFVTLSVLVTILLLPRAITAAAYRDGLGVEAAYREAFDSFAPSLPLLVLLVSVLLGGLISFIVPSLIFLVWFSFTFFAAAADKREWFDALMASREYLRGRFGYILVHLVAVLAVVLAPYAGYHVVSDNLPGPLGSFVRALLGALYAILVLPFFFSYWAVLFSRLRALHGDKPIALPSHLGGLRAFVAVVAALGFIALLGLVVVLATSGFSALVRFIFDDLLGRLYLIRP